MWNLWDIDWNHTLKIIATFPRAKELKEYHRGPLILKNLSWNVDIMMSHNKGFLSFLWKLPHKKACPDCFTAPRMLAVGLSMGKETGPPPLLWLAGLNIDWEKPHLQWISIKLQYIVGSWDWSKFLPFYKPLTVPLHSPNGGHLPAIRAVQGDCETVWGLPAVCQAGSHLLWKLILKCPQKGVRQGARFWPMCVWCL